VPIARDRTVTAAHWLVLVAGGMSFLLGQRHRHGVPWLESSRLASITAWLNDMGMAG
jgi:hypothetical protein